MKKQIYISPATKIHKLTMAEGILLPVSGGNTGIQWGGSPTDDEYNDMSADVKRSSSSWDDIWE